MNGAEVAGAAPVESAVTGAVDPAVLFDAWTVEFRALIAEDAGLTGAPVAGDLAEVPPILMTLATVGPDGYPRTRNVMVSHTGAGAGSATGDDAADAGRIFLHTDSRSEKARHLASDPRVSLTVLAADRSKQVTVVGDAVRSTPDEEAEAFASRVRDLQLLAWINDNELAGQPEAERHARWASFSAAHPDLASSPPETWAGFAVVPASTRSGPVTVTGRRSGPTSRVPAVLPVTVTAGTWRSGLADAGVSGPVSNTQPEAVFAPATILPLRDADTGSVTAGNPHVTVLRTSPTPGRG